MIPHNRLEQCLSFINQHLRNGHNRDFGQSESHFRVVTISRQAGCGAQIIAQRLAERLQAHLPPEAPPWTVFDRNLIEQVLSDHHLPQRLAKFLPENWTGEFRDRIDEFFGIHPSSWLIVRQTAETIFRLARLGHVIIIGRGANIVTARMPGAFHVRLVAPFESRLLKIQESNQLSRKEAIAFIQQEDLGRKRYLSRHYHKDIDDPLLYHMIVNTDLFGYERCADIIAHSVTSPHSESQPA